MRGGRGGLGWTILIQSSDAWLAFKHMLEGRAGGRDENGGSREGGGDDDRTHPYAHTHSMYNECMYGKSTLLRTPPSSVLYHGTLVVWNVPTITQYLTAMRGMWNVECGM